MNIDQELQTLADINLPISKGDEILTGHWLNHKERVKTIGKDKHGQPTVNGRPILRVRIPKLMAKTPVTSKDSYIKDSYIDEFSTGVKSIISALTAAIPESKNVKIEFTGWSADSQVQHASLISGQGSHSKDRGNLVFSPENPAIRVDVNLHSNYTDAQEPDFTQVVRSLSDTSAIWAIADFITNKVAFIKYRTAVKDRLDNIFSVRYLLGTLVKKSNKSIEQIVEEEAAYWADEDDLAGMCKVIADGVTKALRKHGYQADTVQGQFQVDEPYDRTLDGEMLNDPTDTPLHYWTEIDGKILDITASQFADHLDNPEDAPSLVYGTYAEYPRYTSKGVLVVSDKDKPTILLGMNNTTYWRGSNSPSGTGDVPWYMFSNTADYAASGTYGEFIFTTDDFGATDVNTIIPEIVSALCTDGLSILEGLALDTVDLEETAFAVAEEANPDNIVESAGMWDNPELVQFVWTKILEPKGITKIKTDNGLIIFDEKDLHFKGMRKELFSSKKPTVFLGGEVKTDWRADVIDELGKDLNLIDPVDPDWTPEENIYEELTDALAADEVVFFKGGEGSAGEQQVLDAADKPYEEFTDVEDLVEHLETLASSESDWSGWFTPQGEFKVVPFGGHGYWAAEELQNIGKYPDSFDKYDPDTRADKIIHLILGLGYARLGYDSGELVLQFSNRTPKDVVSLAFSSIIQAFKSEAVDNVTVEFQEGNKIQTDQANTQVDLSALRRKYATLTTLVLPEGEILHKNSMPLTLTENTIFVAHPANVKMIQHVLKTADYSDGCLMIDCPADLHRHVVKELAPQIPEDLLCKDKEETTLGIETETHCTLLFGVNDNPELRSAVAKYFTAPITVRSLPTLGYFDNEETAVYIPVESPDLQALHQELRRVLPNKQRAGEYKPHVTVAYIKKGERLDIKDIQPFEWQLTKLCISRPDGSKADIYCEGYEPDQEAVEVLSAVKASAVDYNKYLFVTPKSTGFSCQYYTLRIPKDVSPPEAGQHLVLDGDPVVVQSVSTPEDLAMGRGGPVADSMIKNGIGWDVNCLPEGHEWLPVKKSGAVSPDADNLPKYTYIKDTGGEGFIIDREPGGQYWVAMRRLRELPADFKKQDIRKVYPGDILQVWDKSSKTWTTVNN